MSDKLKQGNIEVLLPRVETNILLNTNDVIAVMVAAAEKKMQDSLNEATKESKQLLKNLEAKKKALTKAVEADALASVSANVEALRSSLKKLGSERPVHVSTKVDMYNSTVLLEVSLTKQHYYSEGHILQKS